MRHRRLVLPSILALTLASIANFAAAQARQEGKGFVSVDESLRQGDLAAAERQVAEKLRAEPGDDALRFGLGMVQFLRAVEARIQAFHRHGLGVNVLGMGGLTRLPVPPNPNPEPIDAAKARALLQAWVDDLARVESTLAGIKADGVKLPIHFALVRIDFDGDGTAGEEETLWKIYERMNGGQENLEDAAKGFVIAFDRGDVDWLRGYCHLLSAMTEVVLAHDFAPWFEQNGYIFFAGAKPPQPFLASRANQEGNRFVTDVLDIVALIHQVRMDVAEPARLKAVLAHLEAMVALSRSTWKFIQAEVDDDREWIPNPKQHTVVGVAVTDEMVQGWHRFLDEFEAILAGRTLVPFWRGNQADRGLNVRRVLLEPRPFDLVLWVQGTAAAPYLERGAVSSPETWGRINRMFRGEFIGFAIWFN